uniref:PDZ domain-containing protein n=1 Tax=Trichuris muris TaxID=70415 RepID=A0A5S6Q8E7_TRIMR
MVIAGGRSTGVIIKSIVSGGLADQNGCLQRGDHLLAINGTLLHGMTSDQVANILRHLSDKAVTITAGRSVNQAGPVNLQYNCSNISDAACNGHVAPEVHIVPTSIALNPVLLSKYLEEAGCLRGSVQPSTSKDPHSTETFAMLRMVVRKLKSESFGFSVAEYNLGKEFGYGLIVATVSPLVFADLIQPYDIIIRVNDTSLIGLSHAESLNCLLESGEVLQLTLARYHPESKTYKHLVAMASQKAAYSNRVFPRASCNQPDAASQPLGSDEWTIPPRSKDHGFSSRTLKEWAAVCGPEYKILFVELERSPCNETLGIALEGTVDVVGESETCPHHFIRSMEPNDGIVVLTGELKPGDELLEVNGEVLYGRSYVDVLEILQNLPRKVTMIVGRNTSAVPVSDLLPDAFTSGITTSDGPKSTTSAIPSQLEQNGIEESHYKSSTEYENVSRRTIVWSPYTEKVLLIKGQEGLGFSIFECKAFSDRNAIAIVVYSVICNSVADKSGQLFPGDRLISVNSMSMANVRLEEAIGILKSLPEGPVVLEISKPLSLSSEEFANPLNVQMDYYGPIEQSDSEERASSSFRRKESSSSIARSADTSEVRSPTLSMSSRLSLHLPDCLVKTIKVVKDRPNLGIQIELGKNGLSGCIIKSVDPSGAIYADGRLNAGDLILRINNQDLRYALRAQAKAILRRSSLLKTIRITYVPAEDIEKYALYRKNLSSHSSCSSLAQLSLKSFPDYYQSPYVSNKSLSQTSAFYGDFDDSIGRSKSSLNSTASCPAPEVSVDFFDTERKRSEIREDHIPAQLTSDALSSDVPVSAPQPSHQQVSLPNLNGRKVAAGAAHSPPAHYWKPARASSLLLPSPRFEKKERKSEQRHSLNLQRLEGTSEIVGEESSAAILNPTIKRVFIHRSQEQYLGISIVGGKIEISRGESQSPVIISGVFVKSILPDSPAGRCEQIRVGDRIINVNGVSLVNKAHAECVEIIRNAVTPVQLTVESFDFVWPDIPSEKKSSDVQSFNGQGRSEFSAQSDQADQSSLEEANSDVEEVKQRKALEMQEAARDEPHSAPVEDVEATSSVASEEKRSQFERSESMLAEVEGITEDSAKALTAQPELPLVDKEILLERFADYSGELRVVELTKVGKDIGLALAGHRDRSKASVLIAGVEPRSPAHEALSEGKLAIGDEILQVDDIVMQGRSHISASVIIRSRRNAVIRFVLLRDPNGISKLAVDPMKICNNGEALTQPFQKFEEADEEGVKEESTPALREITEADTVKDTGVEPLLSNWPSATSDISTATVRDVAATESAQANEPLDETTKHGDAVPEICQPSLTVGDPTTDPILPERETLIEIDKGGKGLGLSLVGGSDTILGGIIVHEVYPDGAAARDNRLSAGDQLLEVNGRSLRDAPHELAISVLRQTPSKVQLLVYRDSKMKSNLLEPKNIYDIFEVELNKKPGKGLGLSIVGRKHEPGIFIAEVVKGGITEIDGRIMAGDQLLAVNGNDLTKVYQEEAATMLKTATGRIKLKLGRIKTSAQQPSKQTKAMPSLLMPPPTTMMILNSLKISPILPRRRPVKVTRKGSASLKGNSKSEGRSKSLSPREENGSKKHGFCKRISRHSFRFDRTKRAPFVDTEKVNCDILEVQLSKHTDQAWGMGVGKRASGILITSVQPNSPVDGKLKLGDQILAVNRQVVTDQASAVSMIRAAGSEVCLRVARTHP